MQANGLTLAAQRPLRCIHVFHTSRNQLTLSTSVRLGWDPASKGQAIWMLLKNIRVPEAHVTPKAIR